MDTWSSRQGGLALTLAVNLRFDQLQLRESHWVIVDMVGKGGRLRTVPVPPWCKSLIDVWLRDSRVTEGKIFRRVSKNGARQDAGVKSDVVWYAVKRYGKRIGVDGLAPHDLRRTCARLCHGAGGRDDSSESGSSDGDPLNCACFKHRSRRLRVRRRHNGRLAHTGKIQGDDVPSIGRSQDWLVDEWRCGDCDTDPCRQRRD